MEASSDPISIVVENMSFHYPKQSNIIDNLSLTMNSGVAYYLRGTNGYGKSTFFKLLTGLLKPQSGSITIGGIPADSKKAKFLFAYVPQLLAMPPEMKVGTFIKYYCAYFGIDLAAVHAKVKEFDFSKPMRALSGGWRRRLILRLTLLTGKKILLLDEPTAGVDLEAQSDLWEELAHFVKDGGLLCWADHFDLSRIFDNHIPMEEIDVAKKP